MAVSQEEARSLSQQNTQRLLTERKLSVVLDLDHTLVHATADPRAAVLAQERRDVRSLLLPSEGSGSTTLHRHSVKLRPHIKEFLMNPLYETTVYTAGTRLYAEQITVVLSRYLVGADLDHQGLLQLQHDVKVAKDRLAKRKEKDVVDTANQENDNDSGTANGDMGKKRKATPSLLNGNGTDTDDNGNVPKKRRRVAFGAPPANVKTDGDISTLALLQRKVDLLTKQLREAEAKEEEALQLRQRIFGSRIVSRTDVGDLGKDVKSLKRIFPCGGTMAVVVDDREDVWANAETTKEPPHNLLLVRPYHWKRFSGFADVNNKAGLGITNSGKSSSSSPEKNKSNGDSDEQDEQLLWTRRILNEVHRRFYASKEPQKKTVAQLVAEMRAELFKGCKVVLSGLVPLHLQQSNAKPRHHVVRHVQRLGAKVCVQCMCVWVLDISIVVE